MPFEQTLAVQVAGARTRALPRPIAYACALVVATTALVLLGTSRAAAADELGGLVAETIDAVETTLDPPSPLEEAIAPIVDALAPVTDELPAIEPPVQPVAPLPPIVDALLPTIEPLTPPIETPTALEVASVRVEREARPIGPSDAPPPTAEGTPAADGSIETVTGGVAIPPAEPAVANGPLQLLVPLSLPLSDGGTTVVAALLVGLLMAATLGCATPAIASSLRPLSRALSPPVPPG